MIWLIGNNCGFNGKLSVQITGGSDATGTSLVVGSPGHNSYPVAKAFDNLKNHNSNGRWLANASELPNVWIRYDMGSGKIVTDYTIEGHNANRCAKDWTLQGSNDNSSWTTIDTVTGQTGWTNYQTRYFKVDTPGSYRYYKLVVSANNGASDYVSIAEIQLKGEVSYTENGTISDATKPGQGSVAFSAGNNTIQELRHLTIRVMSEMADGWLTNPLLPIHLGFAMTLQKVRK